MSVAEHEAAARKEEATAQAHAEQYDPDAWEYPAACGEYCFTTWTNPTAEHARAAREHRGLAAKHRGASRALRDAEAKACVGIPERDRDVSPFFHREDIVGWSMDERDDPPSDFTIRFRPVSGLDARKLQALVDCHIARNGARGHEAPEMPYCPLVPDGVSAKARSVDGELQIELRVDGGQSRAEVRDRLHRLLPPATQDETP